MKKFLFLLLISPSIFAAPPSIERQTELNNLLKNDCGACHGLTLQGGLGLPLKPENLAGKPDAYLIEIITNGRKGTAMPPWKPFLNQEEIAWLVQFLKNPNQTQKD